MNEAVNLGWELLDFIYGTSAGHEIPEASRQHIFLNPQDFSSDISLEIRRKVGGNGLEGRARCGREGQGRGGLECMNDSHHDMKGALLRPCDSAMRESSTNDFAGAKCERYERYISPVMIEGVFDRHLGR